MSYYTKEQNEKYGTILETTEQIEARLKKHEILDKQNKRQAEQNKRDWVERIKESRFYMSDNNVNFIDD